jgi:hypothetical protein
LEKILEDGKMRSTSLLRRCAITAVVLVGLLQVSAFALIDNAPSWRYDTGTTYAAWGFGTSSKDVFPDASYNPYNEDGIGDNDGLLGALINPASSDPRWKASLSGASGVWALSGDIYATIPNSPATGEGTSKIVLVQLVWKAEAGFNIAVPVIDMKDEYCQSATTVGATIEMVDSYTLSNGWTYSAYQINWPTNPTLEEIHISGNVYVDELIIDTKCVPEPATLAIMGLGVAAMLRLRKK